tara:strand:+ start:14 stop:838 length:825 start_codon:yes stop_codon:yes gene_type:complete
MKPINVYWTMNTFMGGEVLRQDPPVNISNNIVKEKITPYIIRQSESEFARQKMRHNLDVAVDNGVDYHRCPAWKNATKNLYGIKSFVDFKVRANDDGKIDHSHDQEFIQRFLRVRHWPSRLFDFTHGITFFAPEEKTLKMTQLPAYLEDNSISNNTITIPGEIDIAKYQRFLEFAFHLKNGIREIEFARKDIVFYIHFDTDRPIRFKRFMWTEEMQPIFSLIGQMKNHKRSDPWSTSLEFYYNIFSKYKFKERLMKEIKKNLCKEEDESGLVKE